MFTHWVLVLIPAVLRVQSKYSSCTYETRRRKFLCQNCDMAKTWGDFEAALRSGAPICEFLPTCLKNSNNTAPNNALPASKRSHEGQMAISGLYENVEVLGDDMLRLHFGRADVRALHLIAHAHVNVRKIFQPRACCVQHRLRASVST